MKTRNPVPRRLHRLAAALVIAGALPSLASAAAPAPVIQVRAVQVAGSPAVANELQKLAAAAVGQQLAPGDLERLAQRLTAYCDSHGFRALRVVVPKQDFRGGLVRLQVVEAPWTNAPRQLLERAHLWEGLFRPDLAREQLEKLFKVAPDHPDGLATLARLQARADQRDDALTTLARLRAIQPDHRQIRRIEDLLRVLHSDRQRLAQARLLARSGRRDAALAAFRAIFPDGPPDGEFALEYYQLAAESAGGWAPAQRGLKQLVRENPGNLRYQLALAEHEVSRRPLNRAALRTIIKLARDPNYARQAKAAWRGAVMREKPATPAAVALLRAYLAEDPTDTAARERLAAYETLLADPAYLAELDGLERLEQNDLDGAERSFARALEGRPQDGDAQGGMGMVRLRQGRHGEAYDYFVRAEKVDPDNAGKWQSLARTARYWGLMREAREARAAGNLPLAETQARAAIAIDAKTANGYVMLGDVQVAQERRAEAEESYRTALRLEPGDQAALLGLAALHPQSQPIAAALSPQARAALEREAQARQAERLREESEAQLAEGRVAEAIDALQRALAAEQLAQAEPAAIARLYRVDATDTAPATLAVEAPTQAPAASASSYRYRRLAKLLDEQSSWLATAIDWHTRAGTAGESQLEAVEIPVEWRTPTAGGAQRFFRADVVRLAAGTIAKADPDNSNFGTLLLCQPTCPAGGADQREAGAGFTVGYAARDLQADIGTTPLGFPVWNVVGGVRQRGELGDFSYSLEFSRRPVTSTLLSFAGTRDPRSGEAWGGVVATGARVGVSRDAGEAFGFWSSLGAHRLTGENVQDNDRVQLMAGGYWRVINEDDRLFSVGLTGMAWRFSDNAGEYTFGHGGYYSPERYYSVSLPFTWARRDERFSYLLRASVSRSWAETAAADYYPTDAALQAQAEALTGTTGVDPHYAASAGPGHGHSFIAAGEYQWAPQLFVGGRVEVERSEDYAPNRVLFYLRYAFGHAAAQPVALVPDPIIPTSQF